MGDMRNLKWRIFKQDTRKFFSMGIRSYIHIYIQRAVQAGEDMIRCDVYMYYPIIGCHVMSHIERSLCLSLSCSWFDVCQSYQRYDRK